MEKKEGRLKGHKDVIIQDLPGIYSLSPYTLEEVVARNYLVGEQPDAILNIVDGTNIERNLYLTTQLIELGLPVVVAVNMMDLVRKNGDRIDGKKLSAALGCTVLEISALKGEGSTAAAEKAMDLARSQRSGELPHVFTGSVEHAIAHIEESIQGTVDDRYLRWYAIKLFERDEKVLAELKLDEALKAHLEKHIQGCEQELDDDAESIITNQRYAYISGVVEKSVQKGRARHDLTVSDKIDRVVTNRILALPIFAAVMFLVYWIAMGPFGSFLTDWTNDVLGSEWLQGGSRSVLESWGCAEWLTGLVSDGIVAGVGAVLGFVPQMLVLFLMLAILEDVGYMARVAFIMDRIFRKFGLSGKSFIPCGAKTPIIGLFCRRHLRRQRSGGRLRLLHRCGRHRHLRHPAEKGKGLCRRSRPLCHGAARLPHPRRRQRAAGHLGAWLVLYQAGDEQPQVDDGRHRLYVRLCLSGGADNLSAGRPGDGRGVLRHRHGGRCAGAGIFGLPARAQKQV